MWRPPPPQARGRVYRLQLLLGLGSAVILGSESRRTHDQISLPKIRDSPNLEGQVPLFISSRNRVVQLYPQALGCLFRLLLRLAGLRWRYSTPPQHWISDSVTNSGAPLPRRLSLYSRGTDRTEITVYNSLSSVVAGRCLAMACLLIEPLPRSGQCLSNNVTVIIICSTHEGGETYIYSFGWKT
jgi:hypothetical protein